MPVAFSRPLLRAPTGQGAGENKLSGGQRAFGAERERVERMAGEKHCEQATEHRRRNYCVLMVRRRPCAVSNHEATGLILRDARKNALLQR